MSTHRVVVEVEAGHRVARLRLRRLLLDAHRRALRVELDHAVALGILHRIGEDRGAALARARPRCSDVGEVVAVEDVVAEDQRDAVRRRRTRGR